jgi:hypothetical protein
MQNAGLLNPHQAAPLTLALVSWRAVCRADAAILTSLFMSGYGYVAPIEKLSTFDISCGCQKHKQAARREPDMAVPAVADISLSAFFCVVLLSGLRW